MSIDSPWQINILKQLQVQKAATDPLRQIYQDYAMVVTTLNRAMKTISDLKNRPTKEEVILLHSEIESAEKVIRMQQDTILDLEILNAKYRKDTEDLNQLILSLRRRVNYEDRNKQWFFS